MIETYYLKFAVYEGYGQHSLFWTVLGGENSNRGESSAHKSISASTTTLVLNSPSKYVRTGNSSLRKSAGWYGLGGVYIELRLELPLALVVLD